jgi:hypothetical protein
VSTDSLPRSRALYSRPYPVFDSSQSTGFLVAQRFRGRDAQERRTAAHWRVNVPRIAPETDSELPYPSYSPSLLSNRKDRL